VLPHKLIERFGDLGPNSQCEWLVVVTNTLLGSTRPASGADLTKSHISRLKGAISGDALTSMEQS